MQIYQSMPKILLKPGDFWNLQLGDLNKNFYDEKATITYSCLPQNLPFNTPLEQLSFWRTFKKEKQHWGDFYLRILPDCVEYFGNQVGDEPGQRLENVFSIKGGVPIYYNSSIGNLSSSTVPISSSTGFVGDGLCSSGILPFYDGGLLFLWKFNCNMQFGLVVDAQGNLKAVLADDSIYYVRERAK